MKIGHGVVGWDGVERRSDRYGSIHLADEPYDGKAATKTSIERLAVKDLVGKKVRLTCKVVEARKSGHLGDLTHRIFTETPEVGEVIDLGVGIFDTEAGWDGTPSFLLKPEDERDEFWMDPRKLYRLHDQTVDVFAEETSEPCHPKPNLKAANTGGICTGEPDGSIQVKAKQEGAHRILPHVEKIGDGMFMMTPPSGKTGETFKIEHDPHYRRTRFQRN